MIEHQPMVFAHPDQAETFCRPYNAASMDELLDVKHASQPHLLYPNHGFARGGVGHLVSTGNARGSLNRLPQTARSFRSPLATRSLSARGSYRSTGSTAHSRPTTVGTASLHTPATRNAHDAGLADEQQGCSTHQSTLVTASKTAAGEASHNSQGHVAPVYIPPASAPATSCAAYATGISSRPLRSQQYSARTGTTTRSILGGCLQNTLPPPAMRSACKPWEQEVPHPADFTSATRRTRIHDVPAASKWSSISFYETDPDEIRRHIDIVNALDEVHANSVLEDRNLQQMRHLTWAQRQRQIFLRQRQERALAYAQSGVPVRPAYVLAAQANAAALASNEGLGEDGAFHPDGLASHRAADLCGPRPCTTGSIRSYVARWGNHSQQAPEAWGEGLQGSISLPKPTYRKIFDRMSAETRDSPRQAALAWQQKQEALQASKEALVIASQMHELDEFEGHLRHVSRQRTTALRGGKRYDTQSQEL